MFRVISRLITQTTMYQAMIYYLTSLLGVAVALSAIEVLPYEPLDLLLTTLVLLITCALTNRLFASYFKVAANPASSHITALILALIFGPLALTSDPLSNFALLLFLAVAAMGSKYLLMRSRSHIFNPAAFAAVAAALLLSSGASWWVGSVYLLPLVVLGGLGMLYRIRRWGLVTSFLGAYLTFQFTAYLLLGTAPLAALSNLGLSLLYSPLLFFAFVMLTEPMTAPGQKQQRLYYGVVIALGLVLLQNLMAIGYSLELALLFGNGFAALFAARGWLPLKLKREERYAPQISGFWFKPPHQRPFVPGQFMQWSLPHEHPDNRGVRRFFTIASSPTEKDILLVTKFAEESSSFKRALKALKPGEEITAGRAEGDFILPEDTDRELVFIAGGIGITPYRSMIKYLLDKKERRFITLVYAARREEELLFRELFKSAARSFGLQTVYVLSEPPREWNGQKGRLTKELLEDLIKHYQDALFYVAGPEPLVEDVSKTLRSLGIANSDIKRDFFPGYKAED